MPLFRPRVLAAALVFTASSAFAHTNERGLDPQNFDEAVGACTDFFEHANGGWLKSNPIPPEYSQWSLDDELRERNLTLLREMLEDAAKKPAEPDTNLRKIGDFYAAAMDEKSISAAGYAPIKQRLARIDSLHTSADVAALIRDWHAEGIPTLFDFGPESDMKNASMVIAYATQGGLGMPDRDYYLRDDAKSKALLAKYRTHVARMLGLVAQKNADAQAGWVLDLETQLAKASLDRVALREPENSYHIFTVKDADAKTPHFPWTSFYGAIGHAEVDRFSLAQPEFFAAADKALAEVPVAHWQAYLRWHLVNFAAPFLSDTFVNADFDFYARTLRGTEQLKPRWKRVIDATDEALGFAVGEAYVARTFPPEAKQRAEKLVSDLKTALHTRIAGLGWMADATKKSAYAKLDTLRPKIGYPDKWRDYSALQIGRVSYFDNMLAAVGFEARRQFAKIGKPVDRDEWGMLPQTVNAYYNPLQNEIVFPAAQMQPPYFDAQADDALNFGGIGAVIGHEMLHGFDDQGSRFDAEGNLRDWWSGTDRKQFDARTEKLVQQFDAYVPIDGLHINGKLTLGENIADLGGLQVAWDAFKLATSSQPSEKRGGFTPEQRFFLSFAQSWRMQQRPEALRLQVQSNEHAPAKYRVNGPVSNLPEFASAFICAPLQPMARSQDQRVVIW